MFRSVPRDERMADTGWAMGRHVVRVLMTLVGAGLLLVGAFMNWVGGITGDRLSFEAFVRTGVPTVTEFWRSAAMVMLVIGLVGLLGLATARGGLTRLSGALAIAAFALLAIQLARAGHLNFSQLDEGPWLALAGGVVLVLGGMPSTRRRVRERRRIRKRTGNPSRPDVTETDRV
jgi:hypothetical protein